MLISIQAKGLRHIDTHLFQIRVSSDKDMDRANLRRTLDKEVTCKAMLQFLTQTRSRFTVIRSMIAHINDILPLGTRASIHKPTLIPTKLQTTGMM